VECFGDRADRWVVRIARHERAAAAAPAAGRTRWIVRAVVALIVLAVLAPLGFRPGG
jgi:hypothetical protein